jgi:hypothetical protein
LISIRAAGNHAAVPGRGILHPSHQEIRQSVAVEVGDASPELGDVARYAGYLGDVGELEISGVAEQRARAAGLVVVGDEQVE